MPLPDDRFLTVNELVEYSRLSKRTLQKYLHHPLKPLPHRKIGKVVLVLQSEYHAWTTQFKVDTAIDVRELFTRAADRVEDRR